MAKYLLARNCDGNRGYDDEDGSPVPDEVVMDGPQAVRLKHGDQGAVEKVSLHD